MKLIKVTDESIKTILTDLLKEVRIIMINMHLQ